MQGEILDRATSPQGLGSTSGVCNPCIPLGRRGGEGRIDNEDNCCYIDYNRQYAVHLSPIYLMLRQVGGYAYRREGPHVQ